MVVSQNWNLEVEGEHTVFFDGVACYEVGWRVSYKMTDFSEGFRAVIKLFAVLEPIMIEVSWV